MSASAPSAAGGYNPQVQSLVDQYKPYNSAVPGIDVYGSASLAANTAYQNALAKVNQQRQGLLTQYGYTGQIDPNSGSLSNLSVDQHNPYGQLQQLLNNQANEDYSATDAAEARGLHGGLANKAATQLKYQHGGQTSALGQSLFSNLDNLQGTQDSAYSDAANSLWQAQLQQLQLALANGNFNPAGTGDDGGSGGDGGNTPPQFNDLSGLNRVPLAQLIAASKGVKSPQSLDPGILSRIVNSSAPASKKSAPKTTKAKAN